MMNSILVVCAGNICRSPMGEAYFKLALKDKNYLIGSAGIVGLINHPADEKAIKVMKEVNIDISEHKGRRINRELLTEHELILVMTKKQVIELGKQFPFSKGRVFRIGHWINKDVADPYKLDEDAFIESREIIKQSVSSWLDKL